MEPSPAGVTPTHHVPTPTASDYIERKSTNTGGPSKGELNCNTNKSVSLDRWVKMFPTPTTQEVEYPQAKLTETRRRKTKDGKDSYSLNLADTVKMFPTSAQTNSKSINQTATGKLNPTWVEWLMGVPIGWTNIGIENPKELKESPH